MFFFHLIVTAALQDHCIISWKFRLKEAPSIGRTGSQRTGKPKECREQRRGKVGNGLRANWSVTGTSSGSPHGLGM